MIRTTTLPAWAAFILMLAAIVLCTPLLIIETIRERRSPAQVPEYILLAPIRRDGR